MAAMEAPFLRGMEGWRDGVSPELYIGQVMAAWNEEGGGQVSRSGPLMAPWRPPCVFWPSWSSHWPWY